MSSISSASSVSSISSYENDVSSSRHFKNDKVKQRLGLSKELCDVYDMLQKMTKDNSSLSGQTTADQRINKSKKVQSKNLVSNQKEVKSNFIDFLVLVL